MKTDNNQIKRWILPKPINNDEIQNCKLNYTLQKVLWRRGINLEADLDEFLTPSELPSPEEHFNDLLKATQRIIYSCNRNEKIAICGDYDADGMTSTVLLYELLTEVGAQAIPYIPSRQEDGYGLNKKMIEDIYNKDIKLVITVDNGISAFDAIKRSIELGIDLIITDHHKIPPKLYNIFALIHPEQSPSDSPYKYLAGVGIAYMLAQNICNKLNYDIDQTSANVLFCIGTVADMAAIKGANRKWLKECLPKINNTKNYGIREIIKKLNIKDINITTEDIGFKIAPLINAVGRIGDPNLIIDLLTNKSESFVKQLTKKCFAINKERKTITELVEIDAMNIAHSEYKIDRKFLVLSKREWHPGIIGIVAARILEKFNLPTAIISVAKDGIYRGSIRSNDLVKVNLALAECKDILIAYGGHSLAAGFTIKEENITLLKERLNNIALREMRSSNIIKSIKPDAYISLGDINFDLYKQLISIGPYGVMNPNPIFWTRKCRILEIYRLKGNHLKMILDDGTGFIEAVKWNNSNELSTNELIDIAFNIELNNWKKLNKLQLNLLDIKNYNKKIDLQIHNRIYKCQLTNDKKIMITNENGEVICSDKYHNYKNKNFKQELFAKKILTFAEIALGKAD